MDNLLELVNSEVVKFAKAACNTGLRYMVVGGAALNIHGIMRFTFDADIWIEPTAKNWLLFLATLHEMGYDIEELSPEQRQFRDQPQVMHLMGPIDILTYIHRAFTFSELYERVYENIIQGEKIYAISLADLREVKVRTGRSKDYSDAVLIDDFLLALIKPRIKTWREDVKDWITKKLYQIGLKR